jgi:AAA+ superfamily predicted ATPase
MLEYYKGVLFLTTNRVETFDSAFKSRIDVTINYPALGKVGRKQVWQNLLQQGKGAGIDEKGLVELADTQLNGREIKNAIKTAKLLAAHEKKSLDIGHIRTVLEVTQQNMAASG